MAYGVGALWVLPMVGIALCSGPIQTERGGPTFKPIEDDPIAIEVHERLFAMKPMIGFIVAYGSDVSVKPTTTFVSKALAERLAKCKWPVQSPSFKFAPDFKAKGARFDLADAYAYCFIAHIDLALPDFGDVRYSLRPWPVAKIRRQLQRALTLAGELSQEERERLYYALVRSAAIAQEWWYQIELAINARGDVIGESRNDSDFLTRWLIGLHVKEIETRSLKAGIQRKSMRSARTTPLRWSPRQSS